MIHLYSDSRCPFSQRVRIILNEKDMDYKIIDVNLGARDELIALNPYNETPVLVDDIDKNNKKKDLILIDTNIICEYIDERFPHPQLVPIEPAEKARLRILLFHLNINLFKPLRFVDANFTNKEPKIKKEVDLNKKTITNCLDGLAQAFSNNRRLEYIFGESFSLVDCAILPVLWRVSYYKLETKNTWGGLLKYGEKLFDRASFLASLTPAERNMR